MNKKTICQAKRIISIAEEQSNSNLYMVIDFVLLDTLVNLNDIQYSEKFILNIADNSEIYAGIPLKVDYNKLIAGKTDKLTHNYDPKTKKLKNQMIGSFFKFYHQHNEEGVLELCGQVRIPKEFEEACAVIERLYEDNNLNVSYEIIVGESTKNGKVTFVDASEENYLFAYSIVSNPAVTSATAILLVAELLNNQNIEEGEIVSIVRTKDLTQEQFFANTKVHLSTQIAELDMSQVQRKIYNAMREFIVDEWYYFEVVDMTMTYVIAKKYEDGDYYKIDYSVGENEVQLSNMRKCTKTYTDIPEEGGDPEMAEKKKMSKEEMLKKIEAMSEEDMQKMMEKSKMAEVAEVAELENKLIVKETEIATLTATIETSKLELASKETELLEVNAKVVTLSESVIAKDVELAELVPLKEAHATMLAEKEAIELVAKQTALKEKYAKVLSAEILVELAESIVSLDESKLVARVVEIAMASASQEKTEVKPIVTLASRITDNVKLNGAESGSLKEKYSI